MMMRKVSWPRQLVIVLLSVGFVGGCGMSDDMPLEDHHDEEFETRRGQLSAFCEVEVDGYGTLSVEEEYLAQVVTCEHSGAPFEALKAQAIAARGYAKHISDVDGSLDPTVDDQDYRCGRAPTADAIRAVRETSGMVPTHNGQVIAAFYVAGSRSVDSNTCTAWGSAGTQRYVTYNEGRIGAQVEPTSLGWSRNPANRGAMSQNGASCLARNGWSAERILRFFYGDDVRVTRLPGACVDGQPSTPSPANDPNSPGAPGESTCESDGAARNIIPRWAWGAKPPRSNRPRHTPQRFTIHHTVTANNDSSPKRTVRNIQSYHQNGNGWSDIGYHYLIDQQGRIYAGSPVNRRAAHVAGHNTGNIGISYLGNYQSAQPNEDQLSAAGRLIAHLASEHSIPLDRSKISGHRDLGSTSCPGNNVYNKLDRILAYANGDVDGSCESNPPVEFRLEWDSEDVDLDLMMQEPEEINYQNDAPNAQGWMHSGDTCPDRFGAGCTDTADDGGFSESIFKARGNDYDGDVPAATLQQGQRSNRVADLQAALNAAGFDAGPVDGIFGPLTRRGVESLQATDESVGVSGVYNPPTEDLLRGLLTTGGSFTIEVKTFGMEESSASFDLILMQNGQEVQSYTGQTAPALGDSETFDFNL